MVNLNLALNPRLVQGFTDDILYAIGKNGKQTDYSNAQPAQTKTSYSCSNLSKFLSHNTSLLVITKRIQICSFH